MTHQRIRKFNTSEMYPDKGMDNDLCMAVRAGNRVFLRGQTGFDLDGNMTGVGDASAQAENAMSCVKTLLEESGAKLEHICKVTIYITDRSYREEVYEVVGRWLKGIHVCSTGLIVKGLALPEMMMEIDVEAMIPKDD
ncbi:RidA family protein [Candidatus Thioglobus sp.]|nr:RidA family protein [Candidatus Thioglobus sp.]